MFEIDKTQLFIPVKPEEMVEVCYSVNTILVAPADHSAESTKAYIVSARKGSAFIFYIFLFLINSGRGVIYRRDDEMVEQKDYSKVLDEAFMFLESMGFIMDRVDLRSLSLDERKEYVQQQPFFPAPVEETPQELTEEVLEEEAKVSSSRPEEKPGVRPVAEARGSNRARAVVPDQGKVSSDSGGIPDSEKGKQTAPAPAQDAAPALNLWGRILASF
ncbi:MAG: hypothetical protein NT009_15555 [Proteobacteria bacterium]|jgi:hypothetical protein|nr:hypothetical protein [Pseudomonadota bacterium]